MCTLPKGKKNGENTWGGAKRGEEICGRFKWASERSSDGGTQGRCLIQPFGKMLVLKKATSKAARAVFHASPSESSPDVP